MGIARFILGIFAVCFVCHTQATPLLPQDEVFDTAIPTPQSVFGFQVGEQHLLPEQIEFYLRRLAQASDKIHFRIMGATHEYRSQVLLSVSSAKNIVRLDALIEENKQDKTKQKKLIIWLGFSIHGNESSGANAAVLLAYYLAATKSKAIADILEQSIIVIEPVMNPDGLGKFAQYVNAYKGKNIITDANNKEHNEPWPGSRTNHYWFDLNRDWLLLTQPESQNRLPWFHQYSPHVLGDFHEMGWDSTYFFQPGVMDRKHPLIPKNNVSLNAKIVAGVAKKFDERGVLYYSGETFDDFYFGKGSTYPDINGAIGILYEQASARANKRETKNGILSFPDTIKNQLDAAMETIKSSHDTRESLFQYRKKFFDNAAKEAKDNTRQRAIIFGDKADRGRTLKLVEWLGKHQISVYPLAKKLRVQGEVYLPEHHFIIPMEQRQYRLIQAVFEQRKKFDSSVFYDVSAWNIAMAYNMPFRFLQRGDYSERLLKKENFSAAKKSPIQISDVGYLFSWNEHHAPKVLAFLLKNKVFVKFTTQAIVISENEKSSLTFPRGSLFVPNRQAQKHLKLKSLLEKAAEKSPENWTALAKGANDDGIDMGSPKLRPVPKPSIALIVGNNVNAYQAGSLWHYVDQFLDYPVSLINEKVLDAVNLGNYTHIILPSGEYEDWPVSRDEKLYSWIKAGGHFIGLGSAMTLAEDIPGPEIRKKAEPENDSKRSLVYSDKAVFEAEKLIGGAIAKVKLDTSHPLAFGFARDEVYTLRRGTHFLEVPQKPFVTPGIYAKDALAAGYISPANREQLNKSAMLIAESYGKGHVTVFADNPYFRAYWHGASKLLANALFFAGND